jgi:hypothetical protein
MLSTSTAPPSWRCAFLRLPIAFSRSRRCESGRGLGIAALVALWMVGEKDYS